MRILYYCKLRGIEVSICISGGSGEVLLLESHRGHVKMVQIPAAPRIKLDDRVLDLESHCGMSAITLSGDASGFLERKGRGLYGLMEGKRSWKMLSLPLVRESLIDNL